MKINVNFEIEQSISNHPQMKWNDNIVKRKVEFLEFVNYNPKQKVVSLNLFVKHYDFNDIELKQYNKIVNYTLNNNIFFDTNGVLLSKNGIPTIEEEIDSDINYLSEVDFWLNLMIKQPIADETLIQNAITNLDSKNFFN